MTEITITDHSVCMVMTSQHTAMLMKRILGTRTFWFTVRMLRRLLTQTMLENNNIWKNEANIYSHIIAIYFDAFII